MTQTNINGIGVGNWCETRLFDSSKRKSNKRKRDKTKLTSFERCVKCVGTASRRFSTRRTFFHTVQLVDSQTQFVFLKRKKRGEPFRERERNKAQRSSDPSSALLLKKTRRETPNFFFSFIHLLFFGIGPHFISVPETVGNGHSCGLLSTNLCFLSLFVCCLRYFTFVGLIISVSLCQRIYISYTGNVAF